MAWLREDRVALMAAILLSGRPLLRDESEVRAEVVSAVMVADWILVEVWGKAKPWDVARRVMGGEDGEGE